MVRSKVMIAILNGSLAAVVFFNYFMYPINSIVMLCVLFTGFILNSYLAFKEIKN